MQQIAVISDIHGNAPALEAVLNEIERRGINRIICLGDIIGKGPSSDIVIDMCKEKCERAVRGNHEELILSDEVYGSEIFVQMKAWHRNKIGKERIEYLKTLENSVDLKVGITNIRLFHASQIGACYRVHRYDNREKHLAMFDNTDFTGYECEPSIVGYGDIHSSYIENFGSKVLFNTGSVGNPLGGDTRASFAVITGDDNSGPGKLPKIEIVKIEYDKDRAIEDAENSDLLEMDLYINELKTGKYRR